MSDDDEDYEPLKHQIPSKKLKTTTPKPIKSALSLGIRRCSLPYTPTTTIKQSRTPMRVIGNCSNIEFKPFTPPTLTGTKIFGCGVRPGTSLGVRRPCAPAYRALHDPEADEAFVVYRPAKQTSLIERQARLASRPGKPADFEVEVVIDPHLAKVLRPHQKEGVQFLYDCTTGLKADNLFGCIMADEMGLGKTLQCITLLWTLLKQSPVPGKPTIEKVININLAIIVCPSSLVKNWANELKKWLGEGSVRPFSCDNKGTKAETTQSIIQFVSAKGRGIVNPVLIISYETLRAYSEELRKTEIGLMLCDEGHRLKNSDNRTYKALNALNAKRRVILSGTPIQNDLTEYYSLLSFVIPGVLGTASEFRKKFENPIIRGRDVDASEEQKLKCQECLNELSSIANCFIIRRTAELLTKYLPTKYEYIVFCKMDGFQRNLYKSVAERELTRLARSADKDGPKGGQSTLKAMTVMKKLVNHPALLNPEDLGNEETPSGFRLGECDTDFSGKFKMLETMLHQIRTDTEDKIVLISNYTQTLDMMETLFQKRRWPFVRLDGSMTINKRSKIVDQFNDPEQPEFIFLLSSKAGGCGINLIGANRLILFDPDWNPANDAQALARVWRGQAHKLSLSSCVVDEEQDVERHFSFELLRQLFKFNETTECDTHDTFKCKRCKNGKQLIAPSSTAVTSGAGATDTSVWNHFSRLELNKIFDRVLQQQARGREIVSFVFQNKSHDGYKIN